LVSGKNLRFPLRPWRFFAPLAIENSGNVSHRGTEFREGTELLFHFFSLIPGILRS